MSYIFKNYFTKPKLNVTTKSKFQSSFNNSNNNYISNFPAKVTTKKISNLLTHSVSQQIKGYIAKNETNYFNANFENLANENISHTFLNKHESQEIKSTLEVNTSIQSDLSKNKLMDSNKTSTHFVDFNKNCKHISLDLYIVCFSIIIFFFLIIIFLLIINFLNKRPKQKD